MKIKAHTCFVGDTGYATHARNFFTALNRLETVKVRNFTAGKKWSPLGDHHKDEDLTSEQRAMMALQTFRTVDKSFRDEKLYCNDIVEDVNIVLETVDHHYFYQNYDGYKIAYTVWEKDKYPENFFKRLCEYDELWVPTNWQKQNSIKQGYPAEKIEVVPEGVDVNLFHPENKQSFEKFTFMIFGKWEYRKSTEEMIRAFLEEFKDEDVQLILSADNDFSEDGLSTWSRLKKYNLKSDKIKIIHSISKQEYADYLKKGNVFLSCSRSEGWNLPLIEAMACGTPSLYSNWGAQLEYADGLGVPVKAEESEDGYCEPDFEDFKNKMREVYENYTDFKEAALSDVEKIQEFSWENAAKKAQKILRKDKSQISYNFLNGSFVEIKGFKNKKNSIEFIDQDSGESIYETVIDNNCWARPNIEYYKNWKIKVNDKEINLDLTGKKVFIAMDSKCLGDTICWMPVVEKFQEKHNCEVICSTFHNELFETNVKLVKPGSFVDGIAAQYTLGYFFDNLNKTPKDSRLLNLQQCACEILGLDFVESKPNLVNANDSPLVKGKYVTISTASTAGCKLWQHKNGWQIVADYINSLGYKVVLVQKETSLLNNIVDFSGEKTPKELVNIIGNSRFHIGLSSGLSWLAWALNKKVLLISGFTYEYNDFKTPYRVSNKSVCGGCWNNTNFRFDPGDWNWCPVFKNQINHFICSKEIGPDMVIEQINRIVKFSV